MTTISIIVPIYNVEKYLSRCIDSLLRQTYHELEIILVDDGSLDNSSDICDRYSQVDDRIRVIHKQNGGLSDARNCGIDIAIGEYIVFVDSDDYIANDMIEFLYNNLINSNSNISTCGYMNVYNEHDQAISCKIRKGIVLSTDEALKAMMYQKGTTHSAWGKMYQKELFNGVRYPKGKQYEDFATTYRIFSKAKKIIINSTPKYYYLKRQGSIMLSSFSPNRMDALYFANIQLDYIRQYHPGAIQAAQNRLFTEAVYIIRNLIESNSLYLFNQEYCQCVQVLKQYRLSILLDRQAKYFTRVYALVSYFGEICFHLILKIIINLKLLLKK